MLDDTHLQSGGVSRNEVLCRNPDRASWRGAVSECSVRPTIEFRQWRQALRCDLRRHPRSMSALALHVEQCTAREVISQSARLLSRIQVLSRIRLTLKSKTVTVLSNIDSIFSRLSHAAIRHQIGIVSLGACTSSLMDIMSDGEVSSMKTTYMTFLPSATPQRKMFPVSLATYPVASWGDRATSTACRSPMSDRPTEMTVDVSSAYVVREKASLTCRKCVEPIVLTPSMGAEVSNFISRSALYRGVAPTMFVLPQVGCVW